MYLGVRSYENALSCSDYEGARRALEKASRTPKLKRLRQPKQFGYHLGMGRNHGVTWVREEDDGSIVFRLYETDVVIWHPDNSVEIENYGTVTTGTFARTFLPADISLCHPTTRRGESAGHRGVHYCADRGPEAPRYGLWAYCWGSLPRFRQHGDVWLPDEDTLDTIELPTLGDVKARRELATRYNLRDFEMWLSMAPMHMEIEHAEWDLDECADALLKRDFRQAAMHLPLTHDSGAYGTKLKIIPIETFHRDQHVTVSCIDKLKLALWSAHDLIGSETFTTITQPEFERRMRQVRALQRLGLNDCGRYGPPC